MYKFAFYSITTLPPRVSSHIRRHMCWDNGIMKRALIDQWSYVRVCIVSYGVTIVGWSALDVSSNSVYHSSNEVEVWAWTNSKWRRKGIATMAIRAILQKHRISKKKMLVAFSKSTERICYKIGRTVRNYFFDL